jgi:hypothetical protein
MPPKDPVRYRERLRLRHYKERLKAYVDAVWAERDAQQDWENVHRLHVYLARREMLKADPNADIYSVRVGASIAPGA